ncbi:MAG: dihydrolipoamide dehydrogenase [Rhodospirillales bacterium]|nr:dihydrolipoamide dehydrogenase [Rhodospirillales bacterium]MSP80111.1 dihydrolipoamide dehydrogenase [Rhodospirillales bacterium]
MTEILTPDICVIGAGSGGLLLAAGASQMGASVVLFERGRMGGDCLNFGCVPSKSLIAAAHAAHTVRDAARFGVGVAQPTVDGRAVFARVRAVIAAIAPNDSVARFEALGVRVIQAHARFTDPDCVVADGIEVRARRFVVATGSSPAVPPIPGLDQAPYLTNETVFDLDAIPEHLIVLGGGPIGIELAQAFRRLGAKVSVIEMQAILGRDDPELADAIRRQLTVEGVAIRENARAERIERTLSGVAVEISGSEPARIEGTHLLVAVGRRPHIKDLGLDLAGIAIKPERIIVDARLRTTNPRVYAIGDAAGGLQFTHVANFHAGIVLRNILFRWPARADRAPIPRVTYTDPELAQVGLTEAEARARNLSFQISRWPMHDNDRAQAEGKTEGLVKIIVGPRGRILGAGIAAAHAGELIGPWTLAMAEGLGLAAMASVVAPYPTLGEAGKRAAGSFFAPTLFSERTRTIVRLLARLG